MAWYPSAIRRDIGRAKVALVNPQRVTLHTAVTSASSLATAFKDGPFSHFYVRSDGTVEQYQDTAYRAAADLQGNDNSVSVESWDGYGTSVFPLNTSNVPAWTDAQAAAIVALLRWLWSTHPSIPRKLAIDSKLGASSHGVAWHRLGVPKAAGATVSQTGGMLWSTSAGKVCPGDRRIAQIPGIFARAAGTPTPTTPTTGDPDMSEKPVTLARALEILENVDGLIVGGLLAARIESAIDAAVTKATTALLVAIAKQSAPTATPEQLEAAARAALDGATLRIDPPA